MGLLKKFLSLILVVLVGNFTLIVADDFEGYSRLEKQLLQMQQRIDELEGKQTEKKEETPSILKDLLIGGGLTFIVQTAQNANCYGEKYNSNTPTVASYSIDLGFTKSFGKHDKMFLHLETGQGSLDEQLQVFSGVNYDGDISNAIITVTEAWYEHYFGDSGFGFTIGKLDPTTAVDENYFANDETTQFLGCIFRNSIAIIFPEDNSFGAQVFYETDKLDLTAQYLSANASFEDVTKNIFASAQVTIKPNLIEGLEGNYRIFAWTNTRDHIKWNDSTKTDEKNYGIGISFDQEFTTTVGAFARYAWQRPDIYLEDLGFTLEQNWSLGIQIKSSLFGNNDVFAFAYGQIIPSNDYKQATGFKAKKENHFEVYYSWQATDFLAITPDLQIIENPYGGDAYGGNDTIFVGGIRLQINF